MEIKRTARNAAAVVLLASLVGSPPLLAQGGRGQDAWGAGNYDPATEVTLSGTVDEVVTIPGPREGMDGIHLVLRTAAGVRGVHVGPVTFMSNQGFAFAAGDAITVVGSIVTIEGREALIAREIRNGDTVLTLRNAEGIPLWARARRR